MDRTELERVADQYRADGYEVTIQPGSAELPEFLRSFQLDMIARKGDENVVVEVSQRKELEADCRSSYLAAEVNAQPGWRFDLVVINGDPWPDELPRQAAEPDAQRIRSLAETAGRLLADGELEAASLMGWSAAEAAMRDLARRLSIPLENNTPRFVLNTLVAEGILSRDDYDSLQHAMRARNALAHGLSFPNLGAATPRFLIDTTRRLLEIEFAPNET